MGMPATFIRFSGCNLNCRYCDTKHATGRDLQLMDVLREVRCGPPRVIITGGEPLLAPDALFDLVKAIAETGRTIDIETNGTFTPPAGFASYIENYVISPKMSNSGNNRDKARLAPSLPEGPLKFVVEDHDDLEEVKTFVKDFPEREILIMPLGSEPETMIERLGVLREPVASYGWRLIPRLHILLGIK